MQESQMIESEGSLTHQLLWYCSKPAYAWWHGAPTTNLGIFNTDSISWVAGFFHYFCKWSPLCV